MRRDAPRIGVEVLLLTMILAVLGAGLSLVMQAQRRVAAKQNAMVTAVAIPEKSADPPIAIEPPTPAPIDLTPEKLRPINALIATEKARAAEQVRLAVERLEAANRALDEARQSRVDEILARKEAAARESVALQVEDQRDRYARERDILAEKRDDARSALERQRFRSRDGVAVLPYKGPNGTWRRPIAIECRNNKATLQPGGPSFSMDEMANFPNPRRSPLVYAVAKAMVRARSTRTPDGAASVPYLMFIVRPDGVRPYYAARTLLEPLGITYGYELADADWDIEFPDLDDPSEWTEIPASKPSSVWPPPPADDPAPGIGLAAKGTRGGPRVGTSLVAGSGGSTAGVANSGPGTVGAFTRTPENGPGGTGSTGRAGQLAFENPAGTFGGTAGLGQGDRPLASPGDGRGQVAPGAGPSPWGRSGRGSGDSFDVTELERLGSGDLGQMPVPSDGRVPWRSGQPLDSASPSFRPTPPSDSGAVPSSSLVAGAPKMPERGTPSTPRGAGVNSGSSPSALARSGGRGSANEPTAAEGGGPPASTSHPSSLAGSNAYREAIARGHGLVAPTGPGSPGRSSQAGGEAASSVGVANSATASGGSPGGGGGSSGGAPGGQGGPVRDPLASQSFLIVVSCDRAGLTIHPGGETIAFDVVSRDDAILPAKLRALVKSKQDTETESGLRPRVNFLVKPGGEVTYLKARWQTTTATSYPTTWQLVNRGGPRLPDLEAR